MTRFRAEPQTPDQDCRQMRSVEWSFVLKVAERSNKKLGSRLARDMLTSFLLSRAELFRLNNQPCMQIGENCRDYEHVGVHKVALPPCIPQTLI